MRGIENDAVKEARGISVVGAWVAGSGKKVYSNSHCKPRLF
jgi:hypothetical protein